MIIINWLKSILQPLFDFFDELVEAMLDASSKYLYFRLPKSKITSLDDYRRLGLTVVAYCAFCLVMSFVLAIFKVFLLGGCVILLFLLNKYQQKLTKLEHKK